MINYETIISAYKDRPTLMQWLKKVEKALNDASATSFSVNKKGNATISFQIDFADGSSLESGDIVLQQGESVQSAAIVNGHLILTLTNGDELDAGSVGAVSGFSIDASQHLIVTYQDGTSFDLGAIFNGNVNIAGTLAVSTSISTPKITSSAASIEAEKPIIEAMPSTYDIIPRTATNVTLTIDYGGIVKNGNKLTIAIVGSVTRTGVVTGNSFNVATIKMPTTIGALIEPLRNNWVEMKNLYLANDYASGVNIPVLLIKADNGTFDLRIYSSQTMTEGTTYYFRYECTFLLGENLAA